jgi:hypothetical protein
MPGLGVALAGVGLSVVVVVLVILISRDHSQGDRTQRASTCPSNRLTAQVGFIGAAAGNEGISVYLTNDSGSRCTLDGYPTVQMLGAGGRRIRTVEHKGSSYTIPPMEAHRVSLSSRGSATFFIGVQDGTGFTYHCPAASRVAISPPGAARPIIIELQLPAYGGATSSARCGGVSVSPVIAGIHKRT